MNKQQFEKLQPFEANLKTMLESNFTRNISMVDRKKIAEVYKEIKKDATVGNISCANCFDAMLKFLAPVYFDYQKKQMDKLEKIQDDAGEERE